MPVSQEDFVLNGITDEMVMGTQLNLIQEVTECSNLGFGVLELNSPYNNEYDIIR
jgi:hypothetical protein